MRSKTFLPFSHLLSSLIAMIQNYLKIALRTILKNRSYALLNVAGLSLGLASAFLIFALVRYHFNIDQHHTNVDRIYRFLRLPDIVYDRVRFMPVDG